MALLSWAGKTGKQNEILAQNESVMVVFKQKANLIFHAGSQCKVNAKSIRGGRREFSHYLRQSHKLKMFNCRGKFVCVSGLCERQSGGAQPVKRGLGRTLWRTERRQSHRILLLSGAIRRREESLDFTFNLLGLKSELHSRLSTCL